MARQAVAQILRRLGYAVSEAGTVAAALAALAQRPDWVLLDLMLPDGCGTEVLRKEKADAAGTRICVVTGCGPERLEKARALEPDAVFKKPLDVERMLAVLQSGQRAS